MASTYGRLKGIWCGLLPKKIRHTIYERFPNKKLYHAVLARLQSGAEHEEIYDQDYYEGLVDPPMQQSAAVMAKSFLDSFHPAKVVDVGCGTGVLLGNCQQIGMLAIGLEYSESALAICRSRGIDARKFDIESEIPGGIVADLVVSTEVAEHLHEKYADRFVDLLCSISGNVVLTAAVPGSTGDDHVNEQPNEYWIDKFAQRGYVHDQALSARWRREWPAAGVHGIYHSTVMVFRKTPA
jgi:SAM-dependent methyltransferase